MIDVHKNLNELKSQLVDYPLPPNSRVEKIEADITENEGNGDYCHYWVYLTIVTSLSENEIRSFYEDAEISGLKQEHENNFLFIEFPDKPFIYNELIYTIRVHDMTEVFSDMYCR